MSGTGSLSNTGFRTLDGNSNNGVTLEHGAGDGRILLYSANAARGQITANTFKATVNGLDLRTSNADNVTISTNDTTRMTVSGSNGDVTVNALLIAGSGVAIGGTGSANTLDDYEEGTWTPSLSYQNPSGVSLSYTYQVGLYTKIGNIVHVRFSIKVNISGSPVNDNILIAGLPFTSQNATNSEGSNIASDLNITGKANYVATTSTNNTVASIVTSDIQGNQGDDIGVGSNIQFHGGITYIAA